MYRQIINPAVALEEHAPLGEIVDIMGKPYCLKREISREEYDKQQESYSRRDRERGFPPAKRGVYDAQTQQYEPMSKLPDSFQYCYEIEPATAADPPGRPEA